MRIALFAAALLAGLASAHAQSPDAANSWADLAANVFDGRPIEDGAGILSLEAPYRAEDAAVVPMTIRSELPPGSGRRIEKITLLIDENPSPVAAEFTFGPAGPVSEISTRVRVNAYTNVHAVAELSDGKLYMVEKYVKASGGCSAPALKDAAAASAGLGEMKFRWFEAAAPENPALPRSSGLMDAQLMIRHPNNSGLQMDPVTRNYVPAYFVRELTVSQGDALLFKMEGGISISENPNFRFSFAGSGGAPIRAKAVDTDDQVFEGEWPGSAAGAS